MDVVSYALSKRYTNEQISKIVNKIIGESTFDGGVFSLPDNVVEGQISDIVIKGLTATNSIKNGDFKADYSNWIPVLMGTPTVTNGIISFVATGEGARLYQPIPLMQNNKYYLVGRIKANSNLVSLRNYSDGIGIAAHSGSGNFEKLSSVFTSVATGNRNIAIIDYRASGWSETQVDYVMLIDLTQTFGAGKEPTKEQCDLIFPNWFDGTKSTFSNIRLVSVGKNLFSPDMALSYDWQDGKKIWQVKASSNVLEYNINRCGIWGSIGSPTAIPKQIGTLPKFVNGKTYTFTFPSSVGKRLYYTDGSYTSFSGNIVTSNPAKTIQYVALWEPSDYKIDEIQIEEGTAKTTYEPYKESTVYINTGGEPLRSVGIAKDEIRLTQNWWEKIQRVSNTEILNADRIINYDTATSASVDIIVVNNVNYISDSASGNNYAIVILPDGQVITKNRVYTAGEVWTYYQPTGNNTLRINAPKGYCSSIADAKTKLTGTTLTYQLASPVVTQLPAQNLQVFERGTIYIDAYDNKEYSTNTTIITLDHPLQTIDKLQKIVGGQMTDVSGTLSADGKTITVATAGAYHVEGPIRPEESTLPTTTISYPMNLKAQVLGNTAGILQHDKAIGRLDNFVALAYAETQLELAKLNVRVSALEAK